MNMSFMQFFGSLFTGEICASHFWNFPECLPRGPSRLDPQGGQLHFGWGITLKPCETFGRVAGAAGKHFVVSEKRTPKNKNKRPAGTCKNWGNPWNSGDSELGKNIVIFLRVYMLVAFLGGCNYIWYCWMVQNFWQAAEVGSWSHHLARDLYIGRIFESSAVCPFWTLVPLGFMNLSSAPARCLKQKSNVSNMCQVWHSLHLVGFYYKYTYRQLYHTWMLWEAF